MSFTAVSSKLAASSTGLVAIRGLANQSPLRSSASRIGMIGSFDQIVSPWYNLGGIRCATKKAGGSSSNGRDSPGKRLGVKIYGDQPAKAGSIIIRQRGFKYRPDGPFVGTGKDHTLFAKKAGLVKFTWDPKIKRQMVSVKPFESEQVQVEV